MIYHENKKVRNTKNSIIYPISSWASLNWTTNSNNATIAFAITYSGTNFGVLPGTPVGDTIHGRGGDDRILGLEGNDKLYGDSGDDALTGGPGRDYFNCGAGKDTITDYSRASEDSETSDCERF